MSQGIVYYGLEGQLFPESAFLVKKEMRLAANLAASENFCNARLYAIFHLIKAIAFSFFNAFKYAYEALIEGLGCVIVLDLKEAGHVLSCHTWDAAKSLWFVFLGVGLLGACVLAPGKALNSFRSIQEISFSDCQEALDQSEVRVEHLQAGIVEAQAAWAVANGQLETQLNEMSEQFQLERQKYQDQLEEVKRLKSALEVAEQYAQFRKTHLDQQTREFDARIQEKESLIEKYKTDIKGLKATIQNHLEIDQAFELTNQSQKQKYNQTLNQLSAANRELRRALGDSSKAYQSLKAMHEQILLERSSYENDVKDQLVKALETLKEMTDQFGVQKVEPVAKALSSVVSYFQKSIAQPNVAQHAQFDASSVRASNSPSVSSASSSLSLQDSCKMQYLQFLEGDLELLLVFLSKYEELIYRLAFFENIQVDDSTTIHLVLELLEETQFSAESTIKSAVERLERIIIDTHHHAKVQQKIKTNTQREQNDSTLQSPHLFHQKFEGAAALFSFLKTNAPSIDGGQL